MTYKTRGVVVPDGLGVPPGLQDRIGLDYFILQSRHSLLLHSGSGNGGKVGDDLLGVFRLAGTRLSSDENALVVPAGHHALVRLLGYGEDVRRDLIPSLADINLDGPLGVDGIPLVWVDGNTEETCMRRNEEKNARLV